MTDHENDDMGAEGEQDSDPNEDPLLEEQEGKGYGEDEGEREDSLEA
jgi:hypothetical protein